MSGNLRFLQEQAEQLLEERLHLSMTLSQQHLDRIREISRTSDQPQLTIDGKAPVSRFRDQIRDQLEEVDIQLDAIRARIRSASA